MIKKLKAFIADKSGNMVLQGAGMLIGLVCLLALGGLLAQSFTSAANLSATSPYNVSTTTATYYPMTVVIAFVACLALIGMPVLAMLLGYFGGSVGGKR